MKRRLCFYLSKKKKKTRKVSFDEARSDRPSTIATSINSIVSIIYPPRSNYSHPLPFLEARFNTIPPTNADDSGPNSERRRDLNDSNLFLDSEQSILLHSGGRRISSLERRREKLKVNEFEAGDRSQKSWGKTKSRREREREENYPQGFSRRRRSFIKSGSLEKQWGTPEGWKRAGWNERINYAYEPLRVFSGAFFKIILLNGGPPLPPSGTLPPYRPTYHPPSA